jgi:hypothetical protein
MSLKSLSNPFKTKKTDANTLTVLSQLSNLDIGKKYKVVIPDTNPYIATLTTFIDGNKFNSDKSLVVKKCPSTGILNTQYNSYKYAKFVFDKDPNRTQTYELWMGFCDNGIVAAKLIDITGKDTHTDGDIVNSPLITISPINTSDLTPPINTSDLTPPINTSDYHSIVFNPINEGYEIKDMNSLTDSDKADLKNLEVGKVYILNNNGTWYYLKLIQKPSESPEYIFVDDKNGFFKIMIGNYNTYDTLTIIVITYYPKSGEQKVIDPSKVTLYESDKAKKTTIGGRKSKKTKKTRKARKNRKARKSRKHTKR